MVVAGSQRRFRLISNPPTKDLLHELLVPWMLRCERLEVLPRLLHVAFVADDMWIDRKFFEESVQKSKAPPAGCLYRIVLRTAPNEPPVAGVGSTTLRSTKGLVS